MARKHKHPEHENLERWLVSYADFITLLFAFFTVLYALSMTDKAKYKNAVENIQKAFLSSGGMFPLKGAPMVPFEKSAEKGAGAFPVQESEGDASKSDSNSQESQKVAEQIRRLFEKATGIGLAPGDVEVIPTDTGFKIRMGEFLLFKPGSQKIQRENVEFLNQLGKRLATLKADVQIEGHTDAAPSSTSEDNWKLSVARAYTVVRFLLEGVHFAPSKLSLAGYGDSRPIADNSNILGRRRNRRVEILVNLPDHKFEAVDFSDGS